MRARLSAILLCGCSATTNLIGALVDASPPVPCPDDPDLIACLRFEGEVSDESSYGNSIMSADVAILGGRFGTSAGLTQGSSIVIAEDPILDPPRLSIELWVSPAGNGTPHREGLIDNRGQFALSLRTAFGASCSIGAQSVSAGGVVEAGAWTHLACVYDGQTITLYAGGAAVSTLDRPGDVPGDGDAGTVLGRSSSGDEVYEGRLDDVYLWRRARTAQEICMAAGSC